MIPPDYKCGECGECGVKLWRESQTFADNITLRCAACAEKNQKRTINLAEGDRCGWLVPAVPTLNPDAPWWGYSSVPAEGEAWWKALPLRHDGEWPARGGVMRWMPYREWAANAAALGWDNIRRVEHSRDAALVFCSACGAVMTRDALRRAAHDPAAHGARPAVFDPEHYPEDAAAQNGAPDGADGDLCPVVIPTPRAHAPSVLGWLRGAAESAPPAVRYYLVAAKVEDAPAAVEPAPVLTREMLELARRIADPEDGSVEELMESGPDVIAALLAEIDGAWAKVPTAIRGLGGVGLADVIEERDAALTELRAAVLEQRAASAEIALLTSGTSHRSDAKFQAWADTLNAAAARLRKANRALLELVPEKGGA